MLSSAVLKVRIQLNDDGFLDSGTAMKRLTSVAVLLVIGGLAFAAETNGDSNQNGNGTVILEIAAIIIAICALALTVWQGIQTRRHNRLTVKPHIDTGACYSLHKPFLGIRVVNSGLGPAILKKIEVGMRGQLYDCLQIGVLEELINDFQFNFEREVNFHLGLKGLGASVLNGEEFFLFSIAREDADAAMAEVLRQKLSHVTLTVGYESMYGELFEEVNRIL